MAKKNSERMKNMVFRAKNVIFMFFGHLLKTGSRKSERYGGTLILHFSQTPSNIFT